MPQSDPYRLFVSHAWADHDDYQRLFEYLGDAKNFYYINCSRPDDPSPDLESRLALEEELTRQIGLAEVVLMLGGMWEEHHELMKLQIGIAHKHAKPVLALRPTGSQVVPRGLEELAREVVVWNERTIVDAIKLHARGEQTNRFEVIDFP